MNEQSRYQSMLRTLRSALIDEKECHYYLHTPAGTINVTRLDYGIEGFVAVEGEGEGRSYRFMICSEEAMCSFPLEVIRKGQKDSKREVGFKSAIADYMAG